MHASLFPKTLVVTLTALIAAASLSFADTAATPDHLGALSALLGTDAARKSLNLTQSQSVRINQIRADYRTAARAVVATKPEGRQAILLAEAKLETLRVKANKDTLAVLSDAQRQKLTSVEVRALGGSALRISSVQKLLNLTPSQLKKVRDIAAKEDAQVRKVNARHIDGSIGPFERSATLHEIRSAQAARLLAILTPAQKSQFQALAKG